MAGTSSSAYRPIEAPLSTAPGVGFRALVGKRSVGSGMGLYEQEEACYKQCKDAPPPLCPPILSIGRAF